MKRKAIITAAMGIGIAATATGVCYYSNAHNAHEKPPVVVWHLPGPHTDVCRIDKYTWRVYNQLPTDQIVTWNVTDLPANRERDYDNKCK